MELMKQFAREYAARFGTAWPYTMEIIEDYTRLLLEVRVLDGPPARVLHVSNAFREVFLFDGPEGVSYSALPTQYGARSACSDADRILGEKGTIEFDDVFEFVILYLAGAAPEKIASKREAEQKAYPMRVVTVENPLSDQIWKAWTNRGVNLPAAIVVSAGWQQLPVPDFSQPELMLLAYRDPAISFTLGRRAIGFQRVCGKIQYELCEQEEEHGPRLELGHLRGTAEPVDLALEWLGGTDVAELSMARSILRSTFVAGGRR